jgi:hypothetical protein
MLRAAQPPGRVARNTPRGACHRVLTVGAEAAGSGARGRPLPRRTQYACRGCQWLTTTKHYDNGEDSGSRCGIFNGSRDTRNGTMSPPLPVLAPTPTCGDVQVTA